MNLVKVYRKNIKVRFILIENIETEPRLVMGTMLNRNEYVIMDMETGGPFLSMSPGYSWMGIRYIFTPTGFNPKALILQPKNGEGMDAVAEDLAEERLRLNLQPRYQLRQTPPMYDPYTYESNITRRA